MLVLKAQLGPRLRNSEVWAENSGHPPVHLKSHRAGLAWSQQEGVRRGRGCPFSRWCAQGRIPFPGGVENG